jgi:hypothetical protein
VCNFGFRCGLPLKAEVKQYCGLVKSLHDQVRLVSVMHAVNLKSHADYHQCVDRSSRSCGLIVSNMESRIQILHRSCISVRDFTSCAVRKWRLFIGPVPHRRSPVRYLMAPVFRNCFWITKEPRASILQIIQYCCFSDFIPGQGTFYRTR